MLTITIKPRPKRRKSSDTNSAAIIKANRAYVLPEELFSRIFGHLEDIDIVPSRDFDEYPFVRTTSAAIITCSQVCKLFLRISRRHIFKEISIQFNMHGVERMLQFVDILDATPCIASCVQVLKVDCTKWFGNILPATLLGILQRVLAQLPNLSHFSGGLPSQDLALRDGNESNTTHLDFRDRLVERYAFDGSLRSLHLSVLTPNTPLSDIFRSVSLRKFKISSKGRDLVAFLDLPDSRLTHLEIETKVFRFSTLWFLPHLEVLKITAEKGIAHDAPFRYPSFKLKTICSNFEMSEWSYRLLSVLQSKARDRNQKPFETLERLEISLKSASVVQNVLYIIQGMSALRGLDVVGMCSGLTVHGVRKA